MIAKILLGLLAAGFLTLVYCVGLSIHNAGPRN